MPLEITKEALRMARDTADLAPDHPDAPPTVPDPVVDTDDHTGRIINPPPPGTPHVHINTAGGWRLATAEEAAAFAEAGGTGSTETPGAPGGEGTPPQDLPDDLELPEDFPGYAALEAADITTYGEVRAIAAAGELTEITGIGDATAAKITDALGTTGTGQ